MKTKIQLISFLLFFSNICVAQLIQARKTIINLNSPDRVPNQYIVIYNENYLRSTQGDGFLSGIDNTTQIIADESGSEILHTYDSAIIGSTIYNTNQKRIHRLLFNPIVKNIYADFYGKALTSQVNPPHHLDRIDEEDYPLDGLYSYDVDGNGVNV